MLVRFLLGSSLILSCAAPAAHEDAHALPRESAASISMVLPADREGGVFDVQVDVVATGTSLDDSEVIEAQSAAVRRASHRISEALFHERDVSMKPMTATQIEEIIASAVEQSDLPVGATVHTEIRPR